MLHLWLVSQWGWRNAYGVLGVGIWLLLFPAIALLFRNHPGEVGQTLDGGRLGAEKAVRKSHSGVELWGLTLRETTRTSSFWIVASGTAMFGLIHTAIFFCIVPIFHDRGLTASDAASSLTVLAGCLAATQLLGGVLADRVRAAWLLSIGTLGLSVAIVLLLFVHSATTALVAGAVLGSSQGIFFGATHPLWARYFGRRHLGKIRGLLMTINVGTSSLGPLLAGLTRDWRGEFDLALIVFAIAPLPVAALSLFVAPPPRPNSDTANLITTEI